MRYLGQLITFQQQETTEIKNRIRAAWATFHKYRQGQRSNKRLSVKVLQDTKANIDIMTTKDVQ